MEYFTTDFYNFRAQLSKFVFGMISWALAFDSLAEKGLLTTPHY